MKKFKVYNYQTGEESNEDPIEAMDLEEAQTLILEGLNLEVKEEEGLVIMRDTKELLGSLFNELTEEEKEHLGDVDMNWCDKCGVIEYSEDLIWADYIEDDRTNKLMHDKDLTSICVDCFKQLGKSVELTKAFVGQDEYKNLWLVYHLQKGAGNCYHKISLECENIQKAVVLNIEPITEEFDIPTTI